ncbi:MAG: hypothetical protein ABIQ16_22185 [Polyangiaceae bacterium]
MIDRQTPGAAKYVAPFALAFVFVAGTRPALAQPTDEPGAPTPSETAAPEQTAPTTNAGTAPENQEKSTPRLVTEATPVPAAVAAEAETNDVSWFERAPLTLSIGEGKKRWALTFYGFLEADFITDSTRSYSDSIGSSIVARSDTYAGRVGRSQFSVRNTRLGLKFESPETGGVRPSAVFEGDFYGPSGSESSEHTAYTSPNFRLRHAYLTLDNDYVTVLAGQTYDVFGWQNYFFPMTAEFLGVPNQVFSRNTQFRLSHTFGANGPIAIDVAASATRPAQRDSGIPDANAGLRFSIPSVKGITTPGSSGTIALPLSLGVSAVARRFRVNSFTPPPAQNSNETTGWGLSVDALLPIIPAKGVNDRGNRLTLTGSFVTGTGIADLITAGGGAAFPTLPNPAQANPPPEYTPNVDDGLVTFDTRGVLHSIDWQAVKVGVQYYLPPSGRLIFSANYTYAHSKNMDKLFPKGGAEIELLGRVADTSHYGDVNLFWDATPAVRLGVSGQYTKVEYLDKQNKPHNLRGMALALYAF